MAFASDAKGISSFEKAKTTEGIWFLTDALKFSSLAKAISSFAERFSSEGEGSSSVERYFLSEGMGVSSDAVPFSSFAKRRASVKLPLFRDAELPAKRE